MLSQRGGKKKQATVLGKKNKKIQHIPRYKMSPYITEHKKNKINIKMFEREDIPVGV